MAIIRAADAPTFQAHGATVTGGAAPSRGALQTCLWRVSLAPGTEVPAHILDHEEVFHALAGTLVATVDGKAETVQAGDTLMVPPGCVLQLRVPPEGRFEAVVALPVGARATIAAGGEPFTPSWAV